MKNKRGEGIWTIIMLSFLAGLAILILTLLIWAILTGKTSSAIDFLKNLLKFRLK